MAIEKKMVETPLMKQYYEIKEAHPEALLLFRVGDFYETFGDDAIIASKVLGIVLTRRANGSATYIELAGFPHHSIDLYLPKLVRAGYKVAVCDQLEDPKLTKKIVKRGVTELVTPGVAYNEQLLPQKENNYLASIFFYKDKAGIAFLDISTGSFKIAEGTLEYIDLLLNDFAPKEVLVQKGFEKGVREKFYKNSSNIYVSTMDEWAFVYNSSYEKLRRHFEVDSLKGFGVEQMQMGITAAGAILFYLENNQQTSSDFCPTRGLSHICSISRIDESDFVWLDRFTLRNLEIFQACSPEGTSLLQIIDKCVSPMGARLLRQWVAMPSKDLRELNRRHNAVAALVKDEEVRENLVLHLGAIGDMERIISRAAAGRVSPREVQNLRSAIDQLPSIKEAASGLKFVASLDLLEDLKEMLYTKLAEDPAGQLGKGDVIASGYSEDLDNLRNIVHNGKKILNDIQEREMARTGISSLKISYNNVFGYYLEVRNTHKDKVPEDWIRKQTLVSAERYITPELKEYEEQILGAQDKIYAIEASVFSEIVLELQHNISRIQENCSLLARLDCILSFALCAVEYNYCKPQLNDGDVLDIKGARHPVIERLLPLGEEFISNDIFLSNEQQQIIILTGPNMSGKSALLRQTALVVLMAQIGSFVPADSAVIGYCDKIFTRVGASDNISRGESTFMVEMLETATILHNISSRSLVLLDEIGRGTSTFDGMSIAWAIVEYIHEMGKGAKTLFATHYHELNELENEFPRVHNYHISTKEVEGKILFLRKLCVGGVAHSFGIHVARLSGMPSEVVESAQRMLKNLESTKEDDGGLSDLRSTGKIRSIREARKIYRKKKEEDAPVQLSFFQMDDPLLVGIRDTLKDIDINMMTPMDAFDLLRELKKKIGL